MVLEEIRSMDKDEKDFDLQWIYAQYEEGRPVSEIANEVGKTEAYVYAQMRRKPEQYEDIKRIREERYNLIIRRVRGMADNLTLKYMEELTAKLNDKNITDEEKEAVFAEIDNIQKIAKQYAERVQTTEGKNDKHVGIKGDRPIEVIIRKAYVEEEDQNDNKQ